MRKAKKQRVLYKDDVKAKAAELEEFLFGLNGDPSAMFDREKKQVEETVEELVRQASRKGGLLHDSDLFFVDARGAAGNSSSEDEEDDNDDDDSKRDDTSDDDTAAGARVAEHARVHRSEGDEEVEEEKAKKEDSGRQLTDNGKESHDVGALEGGVGKQATAEPAEDLRPKAQRKGSGERRDEGSGEGKEASGRNEVKQQIRRKKGKQSGTGDASADSAPIWEDPDDTRLRIDVASKNRLRKLRLREKQITMDGAQYEAALRKQHQVLNPRTGWAKKQTVVADGGDQDEEEAKELLAHAGGLMEGAGVGRLPPGHIETTRLKDANVHAPSDAVVQSVRFHPNGQLLLTAGLDKKLRLFQVDGLRNPLLQAVHFDDMPIKAAAFAAGGGGDADHVVLSGRRPHFYVFDMGSARIEKVMGPVGCRLKSLESLAVSPPPSTSSAASSEPLVAFIGDSGFIPLVSLRSRQWVANLKMSGNVRAIAFTHDGMELMSTGDDGIIHIWDLRTRRCRLAFADQGNIGDASSLALSSDGAYIATGAKCGVVNVYRRADVEAAAANSSQSRLSVTPIRELLNLTTNVDTLSFSPDSQMLLMASRMKRDSLRLAHLPSVTVFSNWPTGRSPLHYVHSADFSPHCGLLTIGNAKGRAVLYRLHHYQQA